MFRDRTFHFRTSTFLAWALWLGVAVTMGTMFVLLDEHASVGLALGTFGCVLCGAAMTLHVRSFFCTFAEAVELGRDVERASQRDLRSV